MRNIHPDLLDCLRRPNPYTELVTEISAPDTSDVLRRPDQFTGAKLLSQTPGGSLATSPRGPLQIASASANIATFAGETGGQFDLNREDANRRLKGVGWQLDKDFVRAVLRTVTVRVGRSIVFTTGQDFELQVFRVTKTPGLRYTQNSTVGTPWNEYAFTPLLTPAAVIKYASIAWAGNKATLAFDLTNHGLVIENTPEQAVSPAQVGELPKYYIVVRRVNASSTLGSFEWLVDTVTARTIAGVGTFKKTFWARNSDQEQWAETTYEQCPNVTVAVEQFQAATEAVYALDLTRVPAAGTAGRVMFERLLPPGTTASLALSTAGSGGPWTAVKHGDVIAAAQQLYHLKVTLAADAALRSSPGVTAIGVEFRKTYDVSAESVLELPTREISLPWLEASIAEAKVRVLRLGLRDYLDVASTLGATESAPKLEVDIYLASRHPSITRDKWLRLERMLVTNRTPSANGEDFTLLSYASRLKKKIPEKKESISSTHVVQAGSTAAQLILATALPGASAGGNEYDNKRYYIRVQKTAVADFAPGHVQEIAGNTGVDRLDFSPALPGVLAAGDVVEVHSGAYNTQVVTWQDADFADIWWELLTAHIGIPPERIGHGSLPRGGKPPTVADRAPGNAAAQAKLKGTFRLAEQENGDEPIDQVSFHLGGATVEIDGQICFVQIYELRDPAGVVTVPLPPVSRVFDGRDYSGLAAAPGLEKRATVLSAQYGKNTAAANPDAYPEKTTVVIDNDAFAWLARTDLEDLGTTELPDKIRRWIYNSSDTGLQLATDEAHMVVRATSTGLRVWPFTLGESQPELTIGDVVVIITDQYTDYDPASVTALRGWLAVRGVVVRCGGAGRQLGIFVPGLTDNVTAIRGGQTGDITSLGDAPEKPTVTVGFNASGQPTINIDGRDLTASLKIDVDKVATPTDAEVEATAPVEGAGASVSILSPTWAPGETLYGKAFAYSGSGGTGQRSEASVFTAYRESGLLDEDEWRIKKRIAQRGAGIGHGLVQAALRRSGLGGVFDRAAAFIGFDVYDAAGSYPLINTLLGRATADLDGPTGIGMDVMERGGNKGDQALDSGYILQAGSADFSRSYTGKNLSNVPDDATSDRRAATANEKTGGSRGYSIIDTGLLIVASGLDFVRSYTNKHLGNLPDDATTDRRAATANQKTGGDRGAAALDGGNVLVAAGADFTRSYTGKNLANVPDDATSDRRAATANEKTGGSRGYSAIDSGGVAVAAAVDFSRSYTGKSLVNVPDDATSDRRAATANEKTGGTRSFATIDSGNIVVAAGLNFTRSYTGKHLGNMPDDATTDRRAVTVNEKTGAGRAYPALDASNKLVTGVTSAATADDGTKIESIKRAAIKAARGAGAAAQGLSAANARRAGEGGTVAAPFTKVPVYTADGLFPMINTLTEEILNARIASSTNLENPTGTLGSGVQQTVAGSPRVMQRGYQSGFVKDGGSVTFSPSYNGTPVVMFRLIAGRSFVSGASGDQRPIVRADDLVASGFTCYAKVMTAGTQVTRSEVFTSPLTTSAQGGTVGPATLANAPSYNGNYKARFSLEVSVTCVDMGISTTTATVAVDVSADSGSTWIERGTVSRSVSRDSSAGTETELFTPLEVEVSRLGLDSTDKIRLRLKDINVQAHPSGSGWASLEGFNNSPVEEGYGVTYTTESGGVANSMTPLTDDSIKWEAWEVV
ncbi:MAG: hypothetical protein ACSLFE_00420 [Gemmatimonadaceae bacterium]